MPNGKRTTVGFGTTDERTEGELYTAFGKWLDLFKQQPQKVLSFKSPYDSIEQIINPTQLITVGKLLDKYFAYAKKTIKSTKNNGEHRNFQYIKRVQQLLKPYYSWPITDFGPDELLDVQKTLAKYEYLHGTKTKRYTRRGVNDTIN